MVIIAVVAFINLITCILILVLERVRMIGILKSLGAMDWTVQQIFLRHAMIIALRGILIGALLALVLAKIMQQKSRPLLVAMVLIITYSHIRSSTSK